MTVTEAVYGVCNDTTEALVIHLEPWGEVFDVLPGSTVVIGARSSKPSSLEIGDEDGVATVYAWPGCRIRVLLDGAPLFSFDVAVPDLPEGVSVQQFMGLTGLDKLGK